MKKLLLSLGALSAVVAPVAAVVACGSTDSNGTNPGGTFETTAVSTKTQAELSAVTQDDTFGRNDWADELGVAATNISGGSQGGVTTYTWNATDLTLKSVDTNGDVTVTTTLTITPKVVTSKEATEAEINLALKKVGYKLDAGEEEKLVDYLLKKSGGETVKFVKEYAGNLVADADADASETHGADDFMVIMNGGQAKDFTRNSEFSDDKATANTKVNAGAKVDGSLWAKGWPVGTGLDGMKAALLKRWGYDVAIADSSDFVIYFQHDKDGKTTIQVSMIVKFGDKHYELDSIQGIPNATGDYKLLEVSGSKATA